MITADDLKKKFGLDDDKDLAAILKRSPQAVSNWRRDGVVPATIERKALELLADMPSVPSQQCADNICAYVDIYNMVAGGAGAVPEWHDPIDKRVIPTSLMKKGVRPVLVRGRSMEPTFKNGAIIGINQNDKDVIEGEAYAVVLPYSGAAVKRLYPVPDGVIIRSDNKEFPEVKLLKADVPDFFILGRVCWVVQEV